jgi:hypothetical protein
MRQPPGRQRIGNCNEAITTIAAMPPAAAPSSPQASPTTISGSGARLISNSEISAPEVIDANINADARPAAKAMDIVAIISCPAPFERLEVATDPNHRRPDDPEAL